MKPTVGRIVHYVSYGTPGGEYTSQCRIDPERGARGQHAVAMVLGGRINQTKDRASVLFLFGTDGAASIVTELIALYGRPLGDPRPFINDVMARVKKLADEGNLAGGAS